MATSKETRLECSGNAEDIDIRRPYTFHIGASWAGKSDLAWIRKRPQCYPSDTVLGSWRDHMLISARKFAESSSPKGAPGEDFFFIQQMRNHSGISFGVADGVGDQRLDGVDPSLFSQALMYYAHQYSRSAWAGEPEIDPTIDTKEREQSEGQEMTPYECLDLAYSSVLREEYVEAGSSTACIISLNASSGVLRSANLGDSGYSIIRSDSVIYTSPPQTHRFNCPKQLAKAAAETHFSDPPSIADTHEVKLRDGDIVIVYTDGLWDNVFPSEMIPILCSPVGETEDEQVQNMADRMVDYARQCMRTLTRASPFQGEARKNGMWYFEGGKPDDVTVIVCLIRETS